MEENQVPNPEQQNNNVTGKQKTKKKMGPVKGLLLAILIVFLICVLGLLIRMVVAGDGDYFKPIKDIFGIEEKEDKKSSNSSKGGESSVKSASRYALLSSDTEGENVKHYRLTLDMGDFFSKIMEEYSTINDFSDDNDYSYNEDEDEDEDECYEPQVVFNKDGVVATIEWELGDVFIDGLSEDEINYIKEVK